MKTIFNVIILLLIFSVPLYSQGKISKNASQFQLDVFGPGSLFSINFDSRFAKKENGIGYRFGIGGSPLSVLGKSCNRGLRLAMPVGLNYLVGKNKHLLEIGGGIVPTLTGGTKIFCLPVPGSKRYFFNDDMGSYWYLLAGYRYQPVRNKGFTYRLFISPLLQNNFPAKFWGGASIGLRL